MKKNIKYIVSGLLLIFLFFLLPRLILGTDSIIRIYDNLDAPVGGSLDFILGEVGKKTIGFTINFITLLNYLFKPFVAYVINDVIVHLVAFIGLFVLLQKYLLPEDDENGLIIFGVSLCFSFLPICSNYGISVAGLPLLSYIFLNLRNQKGTVLDYIFIVVFSIYSYVHLTGAFSILILGLVFLYDVIVEHKFNKQYFFGLGLLIALYSFIEIDLIYNMFFSNSFISHRTSWDPFSPVFLRPFVRSVLKNFTFGYFHAASLHTPIILLFLIILSVTRSRKQLQPLVVLLGTIFLFSCFLGLHSSYGYALLKKNIQIIKIFNFGRFHWFNPLLWYVLFAYCLVVLKKYKFSRLLIISIIIVQLSFIVISPFMWKQRELKYNITRLFKQIEYTPWVMSYKQYISKELFKEIDNYIGEEKKSYRVGSIGLQPSVTQYNGFYTLDGYMTNYPLEYKKRFRKIIAGELEKNHVNKSYFDDYGSRCYFFIHPLNKYKVNNIKTSNLKETEIDYNIKAFKDMGGKYFFSTVKITNSEKIKLKFLKTFEKKDLPWRIHLYQVNL